MKVLLVNPYDVDDKEFGPPRMALGLAYITAMLKKESAANVRILDKFAEYRLNGFNIAKTEGMLGDALAEYRPDIVGFSTYTETIGDVIKDAMKVKSNLPNSLVIIGGAHATALAEETLNHYSFIDVAAVGEGEYTMLDIVKKVPLNEVKGIVCRDGPKLVRTGERAPRFDIDTIPFPARDMMHMEYYTIPSREVHSRGKYRYATMLGSRGCQAACSFCLQVKVHRRFCGRSPDSIMAEMDAILKTEPSINAVEFIDNLFLCDTKATEDLCMEMIKSGINKRLKWKAQTRPGRVKRETLSLMKQAGCFMLGFGFESGSQQILDKMNKRVTVEDCLESARITKEAGIQLEAYFIYGYPGETKEDFYRTLDVIKLMGPDFLGYGRFSPVPGSLDYDRLIKQEKIRYRYDNVSLDWEKINPYRANAAVNYTGMDDGEFEALEKKALYEVIKPVNIRYHMHNVEIKDVLRPVFIFKLLKKSLVVFRNPSYFSSRLKDFLKIVLLRKG